MDLFPPSVRLNRYIYIFSVLSMGIIAFVLKEKILLTSVLGLLLVITGVLLDKIKTKKLDTADS